MGDGDPYRIYAEGTMVYGRRTRRSVPRVSGIGIGIDSSRMSAIEIEIVGAGASAQLRRPHDFPPIHTRVRGSRCGTARGVARLARVGGRRQQERRISDRDGVASARRARCGRPARNLWGSPALYSRRQLLAKVAMTASRVASYPCVGERRGCPHGGRRRCPRARQSRRHSTRPRTGSPMRA